MRLLSSAKLKHFVPTLINYFNIRILLFIAACLSITHASSQRPEQFIRKGDVAFDRGAYWSAYEYYQAGYSMDSSFWNTVKLGNAARMVKNYPLALQCYSKAYTADQGNLFPEGLFWLAMMQKQVGNYSSAEKSFQKFLKRNKGGADRNVISRADQEIKACVWAQTHSAPNDTITAIETPEGINDFTPELAPVFESNRLHYVRQSENGDRLEWTNCTYDWKKKEQENKNYSINGSGPYSIDSVGKRFLTTHEANGKRSIMIRPFEMAQSAQILNDLTTADEMPAMPAIMRVDGRCFLLFSCKSKQGAGGMDLWMSEEKNGIFGEKKNLGKNINTPGDELTPFFYRGKLFFSSDWHEGFGGHDVFMSNWNNGSWSKSVNLGHPVNTEANDLYFTISPMLALACVASNRAGGATEKGFNTCCNDLYFYSLPHTEVKEEIVVQKKDSGDSLIAVIREEFPVRLYFHNDEPNPRTKDTTTYLKYNECYESYMALENLYIKENQKDLVEAARAEAAEETMSFFKNEVELGMKKLEGITDELLLLLEQGHSVHIQVRGFASPRAESDYNLNLTKRRTMSLLNYMKVARSGAFVPYLKESATTKLTFELLPFGENKANSSVSDDLQNTRQSIYSIAACRERKIEVEAITIKENEDEKMKDTLILSDSIVDFGDWKMNGVSSLQKIIYLNNSSSSDIYIDSVVAECGCTEPHLSADIISAGKSVELTIGFHPFGPKGRPIQKKLTIYPRGMKAREITLRVVIE